MLIFVIEINIKAMEELKNNIEAAIHNQVIEAGEFESGMNLFESYELESEDNTYVADFYIDAKVGDEGEANTYEIEITYIASCLQDGNKVLFNANGLLEALEIFNPNN